MNHTRQLGFVFVLLAPFAGPAFANVINVIDYGTNGDGVHENAQSIQKAIDAAAEAGGRRFVSAWRVSYRDAFSKG